jgi:hypothetical protein
LETHIKELSIVEFLANLVEWFYQLTSYILMGKQWFRVPVNPKPWTTT